MGQRWVRPTKTALSWCTRRASARPGGCWPPLHPSPHPSSLPSPNLTQVSEADWTSSGRRWWRTWGWPPSPCTWPPTPPPLSRRRTRRTSGDMLHRLGSTIYRVSHKTCQPLNLPPKSWHPKYFSKCWNMIFLSCRDFQLRLGEIWGYINFQHLEKLWW